MKSAAILLACCGLSLSAVASAQPAGDAEAAIRAALTQWTADFNARNASKICDLFAADLRYDYRGFPERDYTALCTLLRRSLSDRSKTFTYSLNIKEIIVWSDLAVVRLVWTLKTTAAGSSRTVETKEPGLDVLRRQAGSKWKIFRYIAYEAP
jgi:steroid delta-isomerase